MQAQVNGQSVAFEGNAEALGPFGALAFEWAKRASNGGALTTPEEFVEWATREDGQGMTDAQLLILVRRFFGFAIKYGTPNQFTGQVATWQGQFADATPNSSTTIDDDNRSL